MGGNSIGLALDPKRNSLNFIRLVLAGGVVYSHAVEVGWLGWRNVVINGTSLGTISVYGFFGISGYLIAGSATRNGFGRYLWQRFLRIFPGFWVCLLLTSMVFGVIAWVKQPAPHCSVGCYLGLHPGPVSYVYSNFFLKINQLSVSPQTSGTKLGNGSLWTLFFEFLCYLFLAGLAFAGLLKRRGWVALISLGLFGVLTAITLIPRYNVMFNYAHNAVLMQFLILSVVFMAGSVIYLYRDRIPDSALIAAFCAVAFVASLHLPNDGHEVVFQLTKSTLGAFLIAYPMLWLGAHLPFHRIGARNDYSYGMYIYAFPITQLLVVFNVERFGFVEFIVLAFVVPFPFAAASWWLIEKRSLRLKKVPWPPSLRRQRSSAGTTDLVGSPSTPD